MTFIVLTILVLSGCAVPPQVLYQTATGAALICEVVAGVIKQCQGAPQP